MKLSVHAVGCGFAMLLALFALASPVRADSTTYTFIGSGDLTGTHFTYVDPDGFLSFNAGFLAPTGSSILEFDAFEEFLASFDFISQDEFALTSNGGYTFDFLFKPAEGRIHVHGTGPANYLLVETIASNGFGYLLNADTNFDVFDIGELGIAPTSSGTTTSTREPNALLLLVAGLASLLALRRLSRDAHAAGQLCCCFLRVLNIRFKEGSLIPWLNH